MTDHNTLLAVIAYLVLREIYDIGRVILWRVRARRRA
jgi:hypothetical protein